jgi:hypothetical protein
MIYPCGVVRANWQYWRAAVSKGTTQTMQPHPGAHQTRRSFLTLLVPATPLFSSRAPYAPHPAWQVLLMTGSNVRTFLRVRRGVPGARDALAWPHEAVAPPRNGAAAMAGSLVLI